MQTPPDSHSVPGAGIQPTDGLYTVCGSSHRRLGEADGEAGQALVRTPSTWFSSRPLSPVSSAPEHPPTTTTKMRISFHSALFILPAGPSPLQSSVPGPLAHQNKRPLKATPHFNTIIVPLWLQGTSLLRNCSHTHKKGPYPESNSSPQIQPTSPAHLGI